MIAAASLGRSVRTDGNLIRSRRSDRPAAETGDSPGRTAMKKIGSDALRNLPVVGTLLGLVAIAALGLAYWGNVTSRERYLQSRNFRLLADVAEQTQTMLYDSEQIVRRSIRSAADAAELTDPMAAGQGRRGPIGGRGHQPPAAHCARAEMARHDEPPADRRIAPIELWRGEATIQPSAASDVRDCAAVQAISNEGVGRGLESPVRVDGGRTHGCRTSAFSCRLPPCLPARSIRRAGIAPSARWRSRRPMAASCSPSGRRPPN